jgi:hypothetical protein
MPRSGRRPRRPSDSTGTGSLSPVAAGVPAGRPIRRAPVRSAACETQAATLGNGRPMAPWRPIHGPVPADLCPGGAYDNSPAIHRWGIGTHET